MSLLAPHRAQLRKLDILGKLAARKQLFAPSSDSVCIACQYRSFYSTKVQNGRTQTIQRRTDLERTFRTFSSRSRLYKDDLKIPGAPPNPTIKISAVEEVPEEQLPSHREKQRWSLSKRVQKIMDDLMPKLVLASQKINNYTGSDYSGIEALRREIKEQGKF
jgi:sensitive to high expression protein 9